MIAIWVLDATVFREDTAYHHRFRARDGDVVLTPHLEIHSLELPNWRQMPSGTPEIQRWMAFLEGAEDWSAVPPPFRSDVMEDAMSVLHEFKDNREMNSFYRVHRDRERVRATLEAELSQSRADRMAAEQRAEAERQQKEAALAEAAALRERLRAAGVEP